MTGYDGFSFFLLQEPLKIMLKNIFSSLSVVCENLSFARSSAGRTLSKIYDMATFIIEDFI